MTITVVPRGRMDYAEAFEEMRTDFTAAFLGFGFYLATANAKAHEDRTNLIAQLDKERAKVDALY